MRSFSTCTKPTRRKCSGGRDYLDRLNAPTPWTKRVVPSFRNVARSICRVAYTDGVGSGGVMLTARFDVEAAHRPSRQAALATEILPPLALRAGIAGVHLCLADEAISNVETAEKKARADRTLVPTWIVLIEGIGQDEVQAAADGLLSALQQHHAHDVETAVYRTSSPASRRRKPPANRATSESSASSLWRPIDSRTRSNMLLS
jgi:hypothetical protein